MKKYINLSLLFILVLTVMVLAGCSGKKIDDPFCGKWAYNHEPAELILEIKDNGTAEFKGEKYDYSRDDSFITLTSKEKTYKLRYEQDKEDILIWEPEDYTFDGEGTPDGLVGVWKNANGWSYEFTDQGTFRENEYFPGYYYQNDEKSIKLVYNDHFFDTILYYSIDGNVLKTEYPWRYVRLQADAAK